MIPAFTVSPSPRIVFGVDRVDKLGEDVAALAGPAARVLVVADPGIPDIAARVVAVLSAAGHRVETFADLRSDPLAAQVDAK